MISIEFHVTRANTFLKKAISWIFYRISIRAPRLTATLTREIPTRPIEGVYTAVPRSNAKIPNVVYQTWAVPRFGRTHGREIAAFRRRNPDYSFCFFNDFDLDDYMAARYGEHPIYNVYKNALFGPVKTDIWRYCLLYDRGGVYCDIAKAIGMPLSELIPPTASAVISWERRGDSPFVPSQLAAAELQHPNKKMINWALMFAPGHPLLKRAIDGIVVRYPGIRGRPTMFPKKAILAFTGPVWLTECLLASAEAGELDGAVQAGIEFHDTANWGLSGSYVRYVDKPAYLLAKDCPIVR
jgi:mannosyltransferase OCH1-like enzyme